MMDATCLRSIIEAYVDDIVVKSQKTGDLVPNLTEVFVKLQQHGCRMDLPGPTTSVGTRTDYSVGPWDYSTWVARHLLAWGARTAVEEYSDRKLCMSCSM
jgi:hypothetical protein